MIALSSRYEFTGPTRFAYDAVKTTNRRRAPASELITEDEALRDGKKKTLISTTRDVRQNFAVARWAINKHIDFVVAHNFRAKTGSDQINNGLERFVRWASRKENFEFRGKHNRERYLRLIEAGRVVDGDNATLKISGGYVQGIEGDRIEDPDRSQMRSGERWVRGLLIGPGGRIKRFSVHRREGRTRMVFERTLAAEKVIHFGYFDRIDQDRGVSPIASAINSLRSLYDGFDYALAREKVNQFFTFAIYREAEESFFDRTDEEEADEDEPYKIDFSSGPNILDLDPGDRAEYLTNDGTGAGSLAFWEMMISVSLKALDIPFSFYKEDATNFFGGTAALQLYLKSVGSKREDVQEWLFDWLAWRIGEAEADGSLREQFGVVLPPDFDARDQTEWIPCGVPWWNPGVQVRADVIAIENQLKSRQQIRRETYGDDWFDVLADLDAENKAIQGAGLSVVDSGQASAMARSRDGNSQELSERLDRIEELLTSISAR